MACVALLFFSACGGDDTLKAASAPTPSPLLLVQDPGEAVDIFDAREKKAGDEVTVVGRVQHIEKGFAALRLIDDDLEWCGRGDNPMKDHPSPWDYCCTDSKVFKSAILPVEVRKDGEVLEIDNLGIRHLDLIAARGTLEETEGGGLVLVTNGWYRRDRPDLGNRKIAWP